MTSGGFVDWEKWRDEQDALQRELEMEKELREMLGIANRTPARFWFDRITFIALLVVVALSIIIGIPWLIELYRNDPTIFPSAIAPLIRHAMELILIYVVVVVVELWIVLKK